MRFKNRYIDPVLNQNFFKWQMERRSILKTPIPRGCVMRIPPDLKAIHGPMTQVQMTWVGHASVLIQMPQMTILTDPHFGRFASPIAGLGPKRHQRPGLAIHQLPHLDVILISHNHYDHLDKQSIKKILNRFEHVQFIVPLGLEKWFFKHFKSLKAQQVVHLAWDESYTIKQTEIKFLAVQHWSGRGLWDRCKTLWGSYGIFSPHGKIWFSGDLGYSDDIEDIRQSIGSFDFGAIAIGGYGPRWFMKNVHIDPFEAVKIFKCLQFKKAIGIHWGTFEYLSDEPFNEPALKLVEACAAANLRSNDFITLRPGQTILMG